MSPLSAKGFKIESPQIFSMQMLILIIMGFIWINIFIFCNSIFSKWDR